MPSEPDKIISSVVIEDRTDPALAFLGPGKQEIVATFNDGSIETLFFFYADEINFQADELCGLTSEQALLLRGGRDRAYLCA